MKLAEKLHKCLDAWMQEEEKRAIEIANKAKEKNEDTRKVNKQPVKRSK